MTDLRLSKDRVEEEKQQMKGGLQVALKEMNLLKVLLQVPCLLYIWIVTLVVFNQSQQFTDQIPILTVLYKMFEWVLDVCPLYLKMKMICI